jgi:putative flippase GtrA
VIDFVLLLLLKRITGDLLVSVIGARIISSLCNYVLNKHLVFDAKTEKRIATLIQYYLLVIFILTCNYLLLFLFHETLGINLVFGKLLTEVVLFLASYTVQHRIIFRYNK